MRLQMKMFIILDMKKNKIDHFSLKIIVLTSIDHLRSIDRDDSNRLKPGCFNQNIKTFINLFVIII